MPEKAQHDAPPQPRIYAKRPIDPSPDRLFGSYHRTLFF